MNSKQRRRQTRRATPATEPDLVTRQFAGEIRRGQEGGYIATLSTENPCRGLFGPREVLVHDAQSVDLSRAKRGLPITTEHISGDSSARVVVGRGHPVAIVDRELRAPITFSQRPEAQEIRGDIEDEILTDISIEAQIDVKRSVKRDGTIYHHRWTPILAAVVPVGEDPGSGIGRDVVARIRQEPKTVKKPAEKQPPVVDDDDEDLEDELEEQQAAGERELAIRRMIDYVPKHEKAQAMLRRALTDGWEVEKTRNKLLKLLGADGFEDEDDAKGPAAGAASFKPGEDERDKLARAFEDAIHIRAGHAPKDVLERAGENPYTTYRMVDMARTYFERSGLDFRGKDDREVARTILQRAIDPGTANLDSTDFTEILENVLNKQLFRGFDEAMVTWDQWCGTRDVRDFKPFTAPQLSAAASPAAVAEGDELQDVTMVDTKESGQLVNYGSKFSLTWQAIVNDDLDAFGDTAMKMGEAHNRGIDERVYALLTSQTATGPDMSDTDPLFDSNHANIVTTGTAPTEAAVTAIQNLMGRQVDANSILLGIMPVIAVVPHILQNAAQKVAQSLTLPDAAGGSDPNMVANTFRVVGSSRLTLALEAATTAPATAQAWYMTGPPGTSCVVAFLNGQRRPIVDRDEGWSVLSAHWRSYLPTDEFFVDWRAIVINHGGTAPT